MGQSFMKSFDRDSSPVDWCEPNYVRSPIIAEYWNTMSNVVIVAYPAAMLYLFKQSGAGGMIGAASYVILPLVITVGLCSIYFHSTLSLAGQMLDELSIFWGLCAAFAAFLPNRYFPIFGGNRRILSCFTAVFCIVLTGVLLLKPYLNAFILMCSFVPSSILVYKEARRCNERLHRLGVRAVLTGIVAVATWLMDRMFCDVWLYTGFPYLHAMWHILIAMPACSAFVVGAYIKIRDERPGFRPELRFWPANNIDIGIPYVTVIPSS